MVRAHPVSERILYFFYSSNPISAFLEMVALMDHGYMIHCIHIEGSRRSSIASAAPSITMPSQFTAPHHEGVDTAPSIPSTSGRMSLSHDWQSYDSPTPSSNDVEPYVLQDDSIPPAPAPVDHQSSLSPVVTTLAPNHQMGFSGHLSTSLEPYPQIHPHSHYQAHVPAPPKQEHNHPIAPYVPGQRSMSVPTVARSERGGGGPVTSHVQSSTELREPQQPATMSPQGHLQLANYSWGPPPPPS